MDRKEEIIVGVNDFTDEADKKVEILEIHSECEAEQRKSIEEVRRTRDNRVVQEKLKDLRLAAKKGENVMPFILSATKEYATLGELVESLKEVYGEYREPVVF